eukprot:TRINITY_DN86_c0_g1_i2.p1 TRINITY_DN86_c0_g1~~TRINITY_DN86_c0_g1_i2.p1  ORF type:complete len:736 (-),score=118.98 TRINITY_DN86_c0_g1_i2:139-2346(-)
MAHAQERQYLVDHHVPELIDEWVLGMVKQQPEDIPQYIQECINRQTRVKGKGVKHTKAGLKAYGDDFNVPDYCKRDPRMTPTAADIKRKSIVVEDSRSNIKPVNKRSDYATTVAAQFNYAAAQCKAKCDEIIAECEKQQRPFFDEKFWFGLRNSMYPKGTPSDCTVTEPSMAARMAELFPGAPLISDGVDSNDIVQGAIGDCFFIGAASALASCSAASMKPLERLFVVTNIKWGVYGMCLFKNGAWEWVVVDDWIAVQSDGKGNKSPQYAAFGGKPELWPLVIEKAYAKIHHCWDSIDGGWGREALGDLTGGLERTLDLYRTDKKEYGGPFGKFKALVDDPLTILCCAVGQHVSDAGSRGRAGESGAVYGLFKGHCYSVIKSFTTSDGTGFVRVRNPWGNEAEWTGPYSDRSADWNRNPQHLKELQPEFKDDGAFWMKWDDFKTIFTEIDIIRFFPYEWVCISMFGTAPRFDLQAENTFIIKVNGRTTKAVVSLGQEDPKTSKDHQVQKNQPYANCKLSIFKLLQLPPKYEDLQQNLDWKFETPKAAVRSLDHDLEMEPGYYSMVPMFSSSSGTGFYIRVFAPPEADIAVWRFSDGEAKALHIAHGVIAAQDVPPVVVPASVVVPAIPAVPERPAVVPSAGPEADIMKWLGLGTTEFKQAVQLAFSQQDLYNRGKLNKRQSQDAWMALAASAPKWKAAFETAWSKYDATNTGYTRISKDEFSNLITALLTAIWNA